MSTCHGACSNCQRKSGPCAWDGPAADWTLSIQNYGGLVAWAQEGLPLTPEDGHVAAH